MAISGSNNVYVSWWDNKTGNNEIFFASSPDNGKTFDKTINLSNATGGSADSQVAADSQGNNVYVTWWDNKTGSWEVFSRASTNGGKTFGVHTQHTQGTTPEIYLGYYYARAPLGNPENFKPDQIVSYSIPANPNLT